PNVIHSMQYERLASRSGPTEGMVARLSDGRLPKKIAWLQCIGSRDQEHPYCSSICCMYATKEAMLAKQRIGADVECRIFVMDERAFNKEYTKYYQKARETHGVQYTRCRISAIREDPETNDLILRYPAPTVAGSPEASGQLIEERYEMVVLATGVEPPSRSAELARMLGIDLNEYGFCETDKFQPLQTSKPGVYVAGAFQSPKEIAETVLDAAGAAGEVMRIYHDALGGLPVPREFPFLGKVEDMPLERDVSGERTRTGVFVCGCGPVISQVVDVSQVAEYAASLPDIVHTTTIPYACFPEGTEQIDREIAEHNLNRVVVAACSHRTHESLFQQTVRKTGLNPYLLEMTNIREHCAWVHDREPAGATRKAKELVRMAVLRVASMPAIRRTPIQPFQRALVIGGGVSGMTSALIIADAGYDVTLVELSEALGGNLNHIYYLVEGLNPERLLRDLVNRVRGHHRIQVLIRSELVDWSGSIGQFRSQIQTRTPDGTISVLTVEHGVIIIATGGREGTTRRYLHGEDERVVTQLKLEDWIAHRPEKVAGLQHLVMIQCVESEEVGHYYCSRTCCTSTMKNAIRVKMLNPDCQVAVLYKDIITYGFPNYFDEQRFGSARHRQGFIAKKLIHQHYKGALKLLLCHSYKEDGLRERRFKRYCMNHWRDWQGCLNIAPPFYRSIIEHLTGHSKDFKGAIKKIDREFLNLYLLAYQSFLFNEVLLMVVKKYGVSNVKMKYSQGEFVFYRRLRSTQDVRRLSIPMINEKTKLTADVGKIISSVLRKEDITLKGMALQKMRLRGARFKSFERAVIVFPADFTVTRPQPDEIYKNRYKCQVKCILPPGTYATILVKRLGVRPRN
ncbi:tRNA pseudouridine(13) synthase TruD, partial [candidate division WOR-3 bacterium]|nr:tRNA pseudouridine(13) synthase TruD [candidate division WOR-3 bacterium]